MNRYRRIPGDATLSIDIVLLTLHISNSASQFVNNTTMQTRAVTEYIDHSAVMQHFLLRYSVSQKKTCHLIFDRNSGIS